MKKSIFLIPLIIVISTACGQSQQQTDTAERGRYLQDLGTVGRTFSRPFRQQYTQNYSLPDLAFIAKMDSARSMLLQVLDRYRSALDTSFVREQAIEINYYIDRLLMDYPANHEIFTGTAYPYRSVITKKLEHNLSDLNKPALLTNTDFTDYAHSFFSFQIDHELRRGIYRNSDNRQLTAIMRIIPRFVTNDSCREFWTFEYLYTHLDNLGIKNTAVIYQRYLASATDTANLRKIRTRYNEDLAGRQDHLIRTYKKVGPYQLDLHMFLPDSSAASSVPASPAGLTQSPNLPVSALPSLNAAQSPKPSASLSPAGFRIKHPVMVYFHGGSWSEGKPDWFFDACRSLARKGWVACAVEYRIYGRQGTLPFAAVMDARSAIRWLRQHADEYGIDTGRIVASGNSAGGHLVLCTAMADGCNEKTDDTRYSPAPNALMVNSAVYDLTDEKTAFWRKTLKDKDLIRTISPDFLVRPGMPPVLAIHAAKDGNVPYSSAKQFESEMMRAGNPLEFHIIDSNNHFIWFDPRYAGEVTQLQNDFLQRSGY